jgi:hypothetical protein
VERESQTYHKAAMFSESEVAFFYRKTELHFVTELSAAICPGIPQSPNKRTQFR